MNQQQCNDKCLQQHQKMISANGFNFGLTGDKFLQKAKKKKKTKSRYIVHAFEILVPSENFRK